VIQNQIQKEFLEPKADNENSLLETSDAEQSIPKEKLLEAVEELIKSQEEAAGSAEDDSPHKRKILDMSEKVKKGFKRLKLENIVLSVVDEFNDHGRLVRVADGLLDGLQLRVNCLNNSAARIAFI
jgi:hypothetical protein